MGVINIDSLCAGMLLDHDVAARNGRVLLRKGETLSEKHIETFKAWGVTEAEITGDMNPQMNGPSDLIKDSDLYQKTTRKTLERFCYFQSGHPFFEELTRVITTRTIENTKN